MSIPIAKFFVYLEQSKELLIIKLYNKLIINMKYPIMQDIKSLYKSLTEKLYRLLFVRY